MLFDRLRFRQHEDSETHILYVPWHFTKLKLDYIVCLPCYLTVHPGCIFQGINTQIKSKRTDGFANHQSTRTMFITVLAFFFLRNLSHCTPLLRMAVVRLSLEKHPHIRVNLWWMMEIEFSILKSNLSKFCWRTNFTFLFSEHKNMILWWKS